MALALHLVHQTVLFYRGPIQQNTILSLLIYKGAARHVRAN